MTGAAAPIHAVFDDTVRSSKAPGAVTPGVPLGADILDDARALVRQLARGPELQVSPKNGEPCLASPGEEGEQFGGQPAQTAGGMRIFTATDSPW